LFGYRSTDNVAIAHFTLHISIYNCTKLTVINYTLKMPWSGGRKLILWNVLHSNAYNGL